MKLGSTRLGLARVRLDLAWVSTIESGHIVRIVTEGSTRLGLIGAEAGQEKGLGSWQNPGVKVGAGAGVGLGAGAGAWAGALAGAGGGARTGAETGGWTGSGADEGGGAGASAESETWVGTGAGAGGRGRSRDRGRSWGPGIVGSEAGAEARAEV